MRRALFLAGLVLPHLAIAQSRSAPRFVIGPNLRVSTNTDTSQSRNEVWLAASSTDPKYLLMIGQTAYPARGAGSLGRACETAQSTDGGNTWKTIIPLSSDDGCFDPMVTTGVDGRMYVMQMKSVGYRSGFTRVWSSADTGKTWVGPTQINAPVHPDHARITVDNTTGPHRGRVYIAWCEVSDSWLKNRYHLFLNYSDDGGRTFSEPMLVASDTGDNGGGGKMVTTEPLVFSDGTVLITYYQHYLTAGDRTSQRWPLWVIRSTDGAKTFGKPERILDIGSSVGFHLTSSGYTLPIFTVDTALGSPHRDRAYVTWEEAQPETGANIMLSWSDDKGRTWSPPKRVNDNPSAGRAAAGSPPDYRWRPVVAVNKDGWVGVAWYDRRDDPARQCYRYYFAVSFDGGASFAPNVPVSNTPSCPASAAGPAVLVWNATPDTALMTEADIDKLPLERRAAARASLGRARIYRDARPTAAGASLVLSFDRDRGGQSVWHYTGLAANAEGRFHALWIDRRNDVGQIFTAPIDIVTAPEPAPPPTQEANVTDAIELIAGPVKYDENAGTTTIQLQLRNVSKEPVYGPIVVRTKRIGETALGPAAEIANADRRDKTGFVWDFTRTLGGRPMLGPGGVTEVRTIVVRTRRETGLDATLELEVMGRRAVK